tara:strand:+ start:2154 stop:3722 length:1569 start_codon:yes stop_codon:yes gene_type:complete
MILYRSETVRRRMFSAYCAASLVLLSISTAQIKADDLSQYFESIKGNPTELRQFLQRFPKGADLHTHLSGAVYAESFLEWAASDGKCVDLQTLTIISPPCNELQQQPPVAAVLSDSSDINYKAMVDALSMRNYEARSVSGHDQFFATFDRFREAAKGRYGDMVAEVRVRAGRQNILYLEVMQSLGMLNVAFNATQNADLEKLFGSRVDHAVIDAAVAEVIESLDRIEQRQEVLLKCEQEQAVRSPGCDVTVRFLAQVIRNLPIESVYAQLVLAFKLIQADPRIVGLNLVAPEDHRVSLRDYRRHMDFISELGARYPNSPSGIALHAGELTLGLVATDHLGWHIRAAINVAGAKRIGHGIDIAFDADMPALLAQMASEQVLVEINLTSNASILGISGAEHPLNTYIENQVPVALSTDDEGVSRIDLTHEYQLAATSHDLSYAQFKKMSRDALTYSFLPGASLYANKSNEKVKSCRSSEPGGMAPTKLCREFLANSAKARLQWELARRLVSFENLMRDRIRDGR